MFFKKGFLLLACCLILGAMTASAQSSVSGGVRGTLTDPQGAVVPSAPVTITNVETNQSAETTTDETGNYRFTNLRPGNYTVTTNASGFAAFTAENIVVEVGQVTTRDINLTLSGTAAVVEVTAETPVINTNSQDFATQVTQVDINNLPINGRRASNYVLLTPATAPDGNFGLVSFRGVSGLLNNSTIDGGDNNQAFFSEERGRTRISYSISQEAVREFQVNTSNYSAEFGRAAGGVINTVTKSGTNEFHGSLFYYLRDNRLGARNPFSFQQISTENGLQRVALKPEDRRHQFGAAVGGPILRDRLFFFFSYDQQKRNFPGIAAFGLPTFLTTATPANTGLTPAQFNAGINFLLGLTGTVPRRADQLLILPKIDWTINDKHNLSLVYNRLRSDSPAGVQSQPVVTRGSSSFGDDFVDIDSFNATLRSTFTQNFYNELRGQISRDFEYQFAQPPGAGEPATGPFGNVPSISIGGGSGITLGQPNFLNRAAYPDERRYQIADTATLIRGRHTLRFGGDVSYVRDRLNNLFNGGGAYSYGTLVSFLRDYANFQSGAPNPATRNYTTYSQGFGPSEFVFSTTDYSAFFQDDFRVNPRLTVNLGLRYELQQLPEAQIPNPLEPRTANFPTDKDNLGPRIGFAYALTEDSDTTLRGGYGIYYGRIINSTISNAITNTNVAGGQRQITLRPGDAGAPTFPNTLTAPPTAGASAVDIAVFSPTQSKNPTIHQMDLVFERVIARNTAVRVSGLFSFGRNLPTFVDVNLPFPTAATNFTFNGGPFAGQTLTVPRFTGARPNPNFARITEIRYNIKSEYYGLVLQAERRLTDGLQFQTSYTLSRSKDNGQISQTFTTGNVPLNPFDLSLEQGLSNFDIPHKFVASAVFNPDRIFSVVRRTAQGRAIFGGWTIAPVVVIQSGRPFSAAVSGNAPSATSTGIFGAGGFNRLPNIARNSFRTPTQATVDLRISRRFNFGETTNLEFLAEAFNLFNRTNVTEIEDLAYFISGTNLNFNSDFGQPTAAGNTIFRERQIQLAVRFQF